MKEVNLYWKDGELLYCLNLAAKGGDDNVGCNPETVRSYLRLQANCARKDNETGSAIVLEALAFGMRP